MTLQHDVRSHSDSGVSASEVKHISVCICTYKRPSFLTRLLNELRDQDTEGLFAYSVVVVDNDASQSAKGVVTDFAATSRVPTKYFVEPQQNIPSARNKAIDNACGDFIAFIDDDEFPTKNWLLTLFKAREQYRTDGVIGPVKRYFDAEPPAWIVKGSFYQRATYPTGLVIDWKKGRVNNALLSNHIFSRSKPAFRSEFRSGEDQDFFRRMIDLGYGFVWCNEAVVYEVVPPVRWKRSFIIRRALLRGATSPLHETFGAREIAKSLIATPVYAVGLPFAAVCGQHRFMSLLEKLCEHGGLLLALVGLNPVKEPYVTE